MWNFQVIIPKFDYNLSVTLNQEEINITLTISGITSYFDILNIEETNRNLIDIIIAI